MTIRKLIPMTDYVNQILAYVNESQNYKRSIDLIEYYSNLIHQPLTIEMFNSKNPLFPGFTIVNGSNESVTKRIGKSVFYFGEKEFGITLYKKSEHSTHKSGMCYVTSYHLKTINDLCDKGIDFNLDSEFANTDLFD